MVSCGRDMYDEQLRQIDKELYRCHQRNAEFQNSLAGQYEAFRNAWTDSMLWEASYALFDSYSLRNTDSVAVYLQAMLDLNWDSEMIFRTKVCRAKSYALINNSRLEQLMPEILAHEVSETFLPRYLSMMIDIYSRSPELSSYASNYVDLLEMAIADASYPEDQMLWYKGLRAMAYNRTSDAVKFLSDAYNITEDTSLKGACAENLADIYSCMGNPHLEKKWLVNSSLYHLISLEGELSSLYRLSLILAEEGDYIRSANYIRTVIERASSSGYPELVVGSATGSLAITATLDRIDRTRLSALYVALGGGNRSLVGHTSDVRSGQEEKPSYPQDSGGSKQN